MSRGLPTFTNKQPLSITWADRVSNLRKALGREPTVEELYDVATIHQMTAAEILAQVKSLGRGLSDRCAHGALEFEQCPECRQARQSLR